MTQLILTSHADMERLAEMAIATCASAQTRRSYKAQLIKFFRSGFALNREGVALYLQSQRDAGKGTSTLMSAVAAIRKLAQEASIRKLISIDELAQITTVSPGKSHKTRQGMWMTLEQMRALLELPGTDYWGKRDRAILALMLGCGLRRAEMASLPWACYQSREGRMCLVDLVGKGNKRRTVPVPTWAQPAVNRWQVAVLTQIKPTPPANISTKHKWDPDLVAGGISDDHIHTLVQSYGERLGLHLNPHDLRRTLSKLLRNNGAPLEQIQMTLGHESLSTTQRYLGSELELREGQAAVDRLQIGGADA